MLRHWQNVRRRRDAWSSCGHASSAVRGTRRETPAEDAAQLLAEAGEVMSALETLIRRINRTNATVEMGPDGTLTEPASPDVGRLRRSVVAAEADGRRVW
ncbi:hypothetical protein SMICM17S_04778 [Streptomyces microflavus]